MPACFSLTETRNWCYRSAFSSSGLRSTVSDLQDGTVIHCWVPKSPDPTKPNLLLIHGFGANALWQWGDVIRHFVPHFNLYVPDLVFFGDSFTTRPDRTEGFQARSLMRALQRQPSPVRKLSVVGLSYGGFVGYSMAAQFRDAVDRVVICCSGVCMEEKDLKEDGICPDKLRELVGYAFFRPPPVGLLPPCLLTDFIESMCGEFTEEKKDLLKAIPKGRRLSDIPKISQPTLIIWGEKDQVFPVELAYRMKRHVGENAELQVIKNAGHAFNVEKPKEFVKLLRTFLVDSYSSKLPASGNDSNPNHKHTEECNGTATASH
ncbi:unnamed protein product [Linum tenue]|uniref:AB hydrolase-1 domain-containing protein n=1 Tax=Linum tenue TaxID=586396 RepID=A0AAV0MP13_9ROSI|nr:unnamed protein product [Linum tenue]